MVKKYIDNQRVNIDVCPYSVDQAMENVTQITIGDLHANAIKLLYILVRHGICTIEPEHYARLVAIYKAAYSYVEEDRKNIKLKVSERRRILELTPELLNEINALIGTMRVINHAILIRFIGDETADRGSNDYFFLKMLQKLRDEGMRVNQIEIDESNHGGEFKEAYERFQERGNHLERTRLLHFHASSLQGLSDLVNAEILPPEELFVLIDRYYKPSLKLLGYALDQRTEGITLFSHAAMCFDSIHALAQLFKVAYSDKTSLELAATIDRINEQYSIYVHENRLHTLYRTEAMNRGYYKDYSDEEPLDAIKDPIEFLMWNRNYDTLNRTRVHRHHYPLSFVHGHDSGEESFAHVYNLDNELGKDCDQHVHEYNILLSDDLSTIENFYHLEPDDREEDALDKAFNEIPAETLWLSATGCKLGDVLSDKLVRWMGLLPELTTLNLSHTCLSKKSDHYELATIIAAIPSSVKTLNISGNHLSTIPLEQLKQALRLLPKNITSLNMSDNGFAGKWELLGDIISVLPPDLHIIFDTEQNCTRENLQQFIACSQRSDTIPSQDLETQVPSASASNTQDRTNEDGDLIFLGEDSEEEEEDEEDKNAALAAAKMLLGMFKGGSVASRSPVAAVEEETECVSEPISPQ